MAKGTAWETIRGQGGQLVDEVKRLIHEGNVRRVVVRQKDRVVAEFPLTVGVVGALAAPAVAAIGALVALLADCRLDVEREVAARPGRERGARKATARPKAKQGRRRAPKAELRGSSPASQAPSSAGPPASRKARSASRRDGLGALEEARRRRGRRGAARARGDAQGLRER